MTIRKITKFTSHVVVLALVSAIGFSQTASAAPCSAEIDALKTALDGGICPQLKSKKSKSKKCKGLDRKLDKTQRKLEKGKFIHAARKLSDFGSVIEDMALRRKPKISMSEYEALMDPYYVNVANCITNGGFPTLPVAEESPVAEEGDASSVEDEPPPPPITVQF